MLYQIIVIVMFKDVNLISFKEEFIVAGPRNSVVGILNILKSINAHILEPENAKQRVNSKEQVVLLCFNNAMGVNQNCVRVLSHSWWDYYHNPKKVSNPGYKTYNAWSQRNEILAQFRVKTMETLFPE